MSINVAPGSMSGGTDFMSMFVPGAMEGIAGYMKGKVKRREQAWEILAKLVDLHGSGAVDLPEFQESYTAATGKPWPTETVKQTTPGAFTPARTAPSPGTSPAERGPGMAAPIEPTQDVQISPASRAPDTVTETMRPRRLKGGKMDRTLGQMLRLPPQYQGLADLTAEDAKAWGLDIDKLLANPAELPKTLAAWAISEWHRYGGDIEALRQANPRAAQIIEKGESAKVPLFTIMGTDGQMHDIHGMDDLKGLLSVGVIKEDVVPPIGRDLLKLDKELPAGVIGTELQRAKDSAAKTLGVYQAMGAYLWSTDPMKRAEQQRQWIDLTQKNFDAQIKTIKTTQGGGTATESGAVLEAPTPRSTAIRDKALTEGGVPSDVWVRLLPDEQKWLTAQGVKQVKGKPKPTAAEAKPTTSLSPKPGRSSAINRIIDGGLKQNRPWSAVAVALKRQKATPAEIASAKKEYERRQKEQKDRSKRILRGAKSFFGLELPEE